jgi:hypothetical protein
MVMRSGRWQNPRIVDFASKAVKPSTKSDRQILSPTRLNPNFVVIANGRRCGRTRMQKSPVAKDNFVLTD